LAAGLAWLTFCLVTKPGPGAVWGAHAMILVMSLVSVPMLTSARRLLLDAIAGGELMVGEDVVSIIVPRTLRGPIRLDRAVVAGVIVDADAVRNGDERLRFSVGGDRTYLYSSICGSALPILSPERAVPNLAIVFDQPIAFSEPRRRVFSLDEFSPLRPLQPYSPTPGVLLRVADPARASLQLASWSDPQRVRDALASTPSRRPVCHPADPPDPPDRPKRVPALRRPLMRERAMRSIWPSLSLLGLVPAVVYAGRHGSFSLAREALLLVGFVLLLGGGFLDTRLRDQERGGIARMMSFGLAGAGLMIALAVTAVSTTSG
jgi:hypothetical protein